MAMARKQAHSTGSGCLHLNYNIYGLFYASPLRTSKHYCKSGKQYPHFTDGNTEAQRGAMNCPRVVIKSNSSDSQSSGLSIVPCSLHKALLTFPNPDVHGPFYSSPWVLHLSPRDLKSPCCPSLETHRVFYHLPV